MQAKPVSKLQASGLAAILIGATFLAYVPAMKGGMLWDDDGHITKPELRSAHGLYRIWFDLGATQQYYPIVHSVFWMEYQLWGDSTLGYHLVNISLHAISACLLGLILYRLAIPGWFLAAAIFALHPVQVETVAWMTELKNTLSGFFYFLAALLYFRFDQNRKIAFYIVALCLFVLGLLSKTVIATLPAALLVVFWWQRGHLSFRRDVLPLIPWLIIGATAGLFTAWVEKKFIGAEGVDYDLDGLQRLLLAGHVVWFYLGKLLFPVNLIFVYPRWDLNHLKWWDYVYLPGLLAVVFAAWTVRGKWRGPLAALLFFTGTLFPVLGFFNVFPFIYSFVADHFQYLASLGVIVFVSACLTMGLDRLDLVRRRVGGAMCALTLVLLASLTWRQSLSYRDALTLYAVTLDRNPECWLAHNNLSVLLRSAGNLAEARKHVEEALALNPRNPDAQNNLSVVLGAMGSSEEAIRHARESIRLNPRYPESHNNLGSLLAASGDLEGAKVEYMEAIRIYKNFAQARANLGRVLFLQGDIEQARREISQALQIDANNPHANYTCAQLLVSIGDSRSAIPYYAKALESNPNWIGPLNDLAWILATNRDPGIRNGSQSLKYASKACELTSFNNPKLLDTLAAAQAEMGDFESAQKSISRALALARENGLAFSQEMAARQELYRRRLSFHEQ